MAEQPEQGDDDRKQAGTDGEEGDNPATRAREDGRQHADCAEDHGGNRQDEAEARAEDVKRASRAQMTARIDTALKAGPLPPLRTGRVVSPRGAL